MYEANATSTNAPPAAKPPTSPALEAPPSSSLFPELPPSLELELLDGGEGEFAGVVVGVVAFGAAEG